MEENLYWISTLTYTLVLLLLLIKDRKTRNITNAVDKSFHRLLIWLLFFFTQNTFWGLCYCHYIENETIFFLSSSIFHISSVITTFFWLSYVLTYLGNKAKQKRLYLLTCISVIFIELSLVITNFFTPTLFTIKNGNYSPAYLRDITFINQYVFFLAIGIVALLYTINENINKRSRKQFFTVFMFSLAPIILGIFQLTNPYGPFYSLGYFLGCFMINIFIVIEERENNRKQDVLKPIANTFFTMHLIDIKNNTYEKLIEPLILTNFIGNEKNAQEFMNKVTNKAVSEDYRSLMLDFVNMKTINERMKEHNQISFEFIGIKFGWTRVSFISVEKHKGMQDKVMITTQIIDAEKRKQLELLFKSNNDELTGLLNRRSYSNDLKSYDNKDLEKDLVFVSMDVNGLKIANDTLGHVAGDELLKGAASCMKQCFSAYGRIYRTGGDEFNAIIYADQEKLTEIKQDFEHVVTSWKGKILDHLSVSCGYVGINDLKTKTIHEMSLLADERMYKNKSEFYRKKGIDRRGQKDALSALCSLYTKILKINLTDNTYQIVSMDINEQTKDKGYSNTISEWLTNFGTSGQVHPDDLDKYLSLSDVNNIKDYFSHNKSSLSIFYRRKYANKYKQVVMEIIPANDYSNENQTYFLYVKNIDE